MILHGIFSRRRPTNGRVSFWRLGLLVGFCGALGSAAHATQFGLLSEEISGVNLDVDSALGTYEGSPALDPSPADNYTDKREGMKSLQSNFSVPGGYAGWFIQWGTFSNPGSPIDMSAYAGGSLRFWIKVPTTIGQNALKVSIRSDNIPPGSETQVLLKNYLPVPGGYFDGQWHSIAIPISAFSGVDLHQMRVLFNILDNFYTAGTNIVYVDKLRWDTAIPGALSTLTISPDSPTVPINAVHFFKAAGADASGTEVDVWPHWTVSGSIGNLVGADGDFVALQTPASAGSGSLNATDGLSATTNVTVSDINFPQSVNIYSDNGAGGNVGVSVGGLLPNTGLGLSEISDGTAPEGTKLFHSTFTLVNDTTNHKDAFAVWFVEETGVSRYLRFYESGYLQFWVRTTNDLQVSIRSANIPAGQERSKLRLSEIGVPLDGAWHRVRVSLSDFKVREPNLDFSQVKTFFVIGGIADQIGQFPTPQSFDVDDVRWLTADDRVPTEAGVYQGLRDKQNATSGLVLSFNNDANLRAVTYDQAVSAMAYTYHADQAQTEQVLDFYRTRYGTGSGFVGFHDEYKWDVPSPGVILVSSRCAGPNAWILLAALHYRNAFGSTRYDGMMHGIAQWLLSLQQSDGSLIYGYTGPGPSLDTRRSTEQNLDGYAALSGYARVFSDGAVQTAANSVYQWLTTNGKGYNAAEGRFNVGVRSDGSVNTDKALDCYSWATLALSSFTSVLNLADADFRNVHAADLTGVPVDGFDFSGWPSNPPGFTPPDKDSVWLEGTAQMAVAYYTTGDRTSADYFSQELDKAVVNTSGLSQGLAYATNYGTAYGFYMDSTHPAASSMAWYIFAKHGFNPLQPFAVQKIRIKNLSDNNEVNQIQFSASVPTTWVRSTQYLEFLSQPIMLSPSHVEILTDNTNRSYAPPYFADPTPTVTTNLDSNPAGLLRDISGQTTTYETLSLAWSVKDSTDPATVPPATAPYQTSMGDNGPPASFQWFYMKDRATPAIDYNGDGQLGGPLDGTAFADGDPYVTVRLGTQIHEFQGGDNPYFNSLPPDEIFLEADYTGAAVSQNYRTRILLQSYIE